MTLATPQEVHARLEQIDRDLSVLQNELENAALDWFKAKRDREKHWASEFIAAQGTVGERKAKADLMVSDDSFQAEAVYESKRAVLKVLETRSNVGMAILKSQARG